MKNDNELRPEYDLTELFKDGVKSKYVKRYDEGTNLVLLAPDVASAFPNEEAVNEALRMVMQFANISTRAPEQQTSPPSAP
jgi:hypothetical protein